MNKISRTIASTISGILLLSGCQGIQEEPVQDRLIQVGTEILQHQSRTRTPYDKSAPSPTMPLKASVWLSTTSRSYPGAQIGRDDESAGMIDYHNSATFTGGTKQLLNDELFYPADRSMVYLIGLYPEGSWSTNPEGNLISRSIPGNEDMMFAPEVHNSIETSASYPVLTFSHLLTWLRIHFLAEDQETANAWGRITALSLRSKDQVLIDLAADDIRFEESVSGSLVPVYLSGTDTQIQGQMLEIPLARTEMAYVLGAPVEATDEEGDSGYEYELLISTTTRSEITVPLDLTASSGAPFTGSTSGHQFTITLKFIQGDNILASATVSEWENGGMAIIPVTE